MDAAHLEQASLEEFCPPEDTNTFAISNEPKLLNAYRTYRTSSETRRMLSESGRHIFAEAFIDDIELGTLADICVRKLANNFGATMTSIVATDPLKRRIHFDTLSIDLPLEKSYHIEDKYYWRRVVLAKDEDKSLIFKDIDDFDWRNRGITLKYVELVEACPAEYWSQEMDDLAKKIKDFVTNMHIKHLQTLQQHSFDEHIESELERITDEEEDASSALSSHKPSTVAFGDEPTIVTAVVEEELDMEEVEEEEEIDRTKSEMDLMRRQKEEEEMQRREEEIQIETKRKQEEAREATIRLKRFLKPPVKPQPPPPPPPDKKKKQKKIKNVLDIEVSELEEDINEEVLDTRNKQKYLYMRKIYKYPEEHCHHIDLRFIRFLDNLTSFTIEFLGPVLGLEYHTKHFNFSYDDIVRLSYGLTFLKKLQTFRLRNSRMNAAKLFAVIRALQTLPALEVVDFGFDQLGEDCYNALPYVLKVKSLKSLELEGNEFSVNVMCSLGKAIANFDDGQLEYLGVARNPLKHEGLHTLVSQLIGTNQVSKLNLTGIEIDDAGILCCVATELIRRHELKALSLIALPMSRNTGVELIKALHANRTIMQCDVRGCELDEDLEYEANIIVRRNLYIQANPYIGDNDKTEDEIKEFVQNKKHPLWEKSVNEMNRQLECLAAREDEALRFSTKSVESVDDEGEEEQGKETDIDTYDDEDSDEGRTQSMYSMETYVGVFSYDPNLFNLQQFLQQIYMPGPNDRYLYFQQLRQKELYRYKS